MAARLESTTQRYIGTSDDRKPSIDDDVRPGSTFMETDTGALYRFDGERWNLLPGDTSVQAALAELHLELQGIAATLQVIAARLS